MPAASSPVAVPGQLLVRFEGQTTAAHARGLHASVGARVVRNLALPHLQLVQLPAGRSIDAAVDWYERQPGVAYAEPNAIRSFADTPDDPLFGNLWGLNNTGQTVEGVTGTPDADIDAPEAWRTTKGSPRVTVAIVDTGMAYDHPDLAPNAWTNAGESGAGKAKNGVDDDGNGYVDDRRGWDFLDHDNDPRDYDGHGTHVAGTVGAEGGNGVGVAGVNWNVRLMPLRTGDFYSPLDGIVDAYAYAIRNGADVVQASLKGFVYSEAERDVIQSGSKTLFVVAAGNEGDDTDVTPGYPCNYDLANILCVAATDQRDGLASFSSYGASGVDLAAPGVDILSTLPVWETPIREDFETSITGRWTTGGVNNSWGRQYEPDLSYLLADSPLNRYANDTNSWVQYASPVSLSGLKLCRLRYLIYHDLAPGDAMYVEASTNGTTWARLAAWTGSSYPYFVQASHRLRRLDGEPNVLIRFHMVTNGSRTSDGVYVDIVRLRCFPTGDGYDGDEYFYNSGTSMATPHVAGAAALLWSAAPTASVADIRRALLRGVDELPSLAGKVSSGGRLNVKRSLRILLP